MTDLYNLNGSSSEDHRIDDLRFMVLKNGQTITLPYAMYKSGLTLRKADAYGGASIALDVSTISADILDYDSMSIAKLIQPSFDDDIVKVLTVNYSDVAIGAGFEILISGWAFETPPELLSGSGGEGPVPTPELMASMLQELNFLSESRLSGNTTIAQLLSGNAPKEYDGTGQAEDNHIRNEAHYVNIQTNQCNIMPSAGDFYKHDVVVTHNGQTLVEGLDYELSALRITKIMASPCNSPIYGRIAIKAAIVGQVLVSYRAVGGQTTSSHYNQLANALGALADQIQMGGLLTESALHTTPAFLGLESRIRALETQSGIFPQYQYSFNVDSDEFGWYTIGEIGYGAGDVIVKQGQFYLDVKIPSDGNEFRTIMTLNLDNTKAISTTTLASVGSPMAASAGKMVDLTQFEKPLPKLRIVYIGDPNDSNLFKGGLLQIGYKGTSGSTFHPVITNRSHSDEGFTLLTPAAVPSGMQNDNIQIGEQTWSSSNGDHHAASCLLSHAEGQLLWQGAVSLNDMTVSSLELDPIWDSDIHSVKDVRAVELVFFDRYTGSYLRVRENHQPGDDFITGSALFHPQDLCLLRYVLNADESNNVVLSVDAELGVNSSEMERFELHRIVLVY